jgi:hypothetical protein
MAPRDRLRESVWSFVGAGDDVQAVIPAQGRISPWWTFVGIVVAMTTAGALDVQPLVAGLFGGAGVLIPQLFMTRRIVVATDREILLLESGFSGLRARKVVARLPRSTRLGRPKGFFARIQVGGEKLYVHKTHHRDLIAADAALPS